MLTWKFGNACGCQTQKKDFFMKFMGHVDLQRCVGCKVVVIVAVVVVVVVK